MRWFLFVFVPGTILTCVAIEECAWAILGSPYFTGNQVDDVPLGPIPTPYFKVPAASVNFNLLSRVRNSGTLTPEILFCQ